MTPSQARSFHAVAIEGSFTAAARRLSVSQPTITNQVKQLELQYQVDLFHRKSRGVQLTPTGEGLLAILRRMFGSYRDAVEFLEESQGLRRGRLRVGSYGPYGVTEMLAAFRTHYPAIEISLVFANSQELEQRLLDYDMDVGVFTRTVHHPEFRTISYGTPRLVAIAPRRPPWDERHSINVDELVEIGLIYREHGSALRHMTEEVLRAQGFPLDPRIEIGSREGVVRAVSAGMGAALIFDEGNLPTDLLVKLDVEGCHAHANVEVVCLAERSASPLVRAYMTIAEELVALRQPEPIGAIRESAV